MDIKAKHEIENENGKLTIVFERSWKEQCYRFSFGFKLSNGHCGWDRETIVEKFPEVANEIDLHLATEDGIPWEVGSNTRFYIEHQDKFNDAQIAHHLRIDERDVPDIKAMDPEQLAKWIESQKPRWKMEAEMCIEKYNLKGKTA